MPYSSFISSELANLATSLNQAVDGPIYINKNGSVITAKSSENSSVILNMGFPYQFISGESIYLQSGYIQSPQQIPWLFNYTTLTASSASLWNNSLTLWLDAKEPRSLNVTDQKIVSKDYTFNTPFVENTADFSFTYSANTIDMTNGSMLNSNSATQVLQYFKLGMVITISNQTGNGKVIFQHDNLSLKINQNLAADGTSQIMICLYDGVTFKKGVTFKPNDLNFKYYIYCDNNANLTVSGNDAAQLASGAFTYGTPRTIYIGQGVSGINSLIKLNEILYYQSSANDIVATNAIMNTYFTSRWNLTTYTDAYNIPLATDPYVAYQSSGSLRLFTGDYGNTTGTYWLTYNGVLITDLNRLGGQCGINNNQNGCLKCISLANTQYLNGSTDITTITPFTVVILVRWTVNGGLTIVKFGSSPAFWLIDALATSGNLRINFYSGVVGYYVDYNAGMALNTWYILTYKYSGGLLSNASVRVNGVAKSIIEQGDGTPVTSLSNVWTLPQSSGGTMFYGGLYLNNTAMSNANIEKVEGFFAWRLFSSGSMLGASHPYYSVAPTF